MHLVVYHSTRTYGRQRTLIDHSIQSRQRVHQHALSIIKKIQIFWLVDNKMDNAVHLIHVLDRYVWQVHRVKYVIVKVLILSYGLTVKLAVSAFRVARMVKSYGGIRESLLKN